MEMDIISANNSTISTMRSIRRTTNNNMDMPRGLPAEKSQSCKEIQVKKYCASFGGTKVLMK